MDFKIINVKLQFWVINSLKTLHQKPSVKFLVVASVVNYTLVLYNFTLNYTLNYKVYINPV